MWNNSSISAVIEVFTMHWVMEPSITYGQLWLLIRYEYRLLTLLSTSLISRWTFQEHIENASTVLSQSVATIDRSVGQIIMIILNHSMYAICYLPWRVQIPQEVRGPGGHARQDGAPPGLRQLHRARDARRAGEDGVMMLYCYLI